MHELKNTIIQKSYLRQYMALLSELHIKSGSRVLDIGSGLGFLKPLVNVRGATYVGIEPDRVSFESACVLYGHQGYLHGFFPEVAPEEFFDVVLALSCVDEVPDKYGFLSNMRSRLEPGLGIGYIAVRNSAFFINRFKTEKRMSNRSERSRISKNDLSAAEWEAIIVASGMRICEQGKFWRPWLTGISFTGLKNIAYRLISMIVPRTRSYMLYYKIMVTK
jgi:SAM-dependent methyltransferase